MGTHGPEAVFRYRTTREKNLFFTGSDYLTINDSVAHSKEYEPFHGEFAIDPASGAILRLTLERTSNQTAAGSIGHHGRVRPASTWGPYLHLPGKKRLHFETTGHYGHARMERKLQSLCAF